MPKHITRLIGLLLIVGATLVAGRYALVAHSYYAYGAYRGDSVTEIAALPVQVAPSSYYMSFYPEVHEKWATGIHKVVQCTVCHGPVAVGATPKLAKLENTAEICTNCHAATAGRPTSQPQINVAKHSGKQECLNCHDPHSPLLTGKGKSIAALAAAASEGDDDFSGGSSGGTTAPAKEKLPSGNAALGQARSAVCTTCHGVEKIVRSVSAGPNLAGQTDDHVALELHAFQAGTRISPVMEPIAKGLSANEINDLAAYFANAANKK